MHRPRGAFCFSIAWPTRHLAARAAVVLSLLVGSVASLAPWRRADGSFDDGEPGGCTPYVAGGPFTPPLRLLTRSAQGGRAGFRSATIQVINGG